MPLLNAANPFNVIIQVCSVYTLWSCVYYHTYYDDVSLSIHIIASIALLFS